MWSRYDVVFEFFVFSPLFVSKVSLVEKLRYTDVTESRGSLCLFGDVVCEGLFAGKKSKFVVEMALKLRKLLQDEISLLTSKLY